MISCNKEEKEEYLKYLTEKEKQRSSLLEDTSL